MMATKGDDDLRQAFQADPWPQSTGDPGDPPAARPSPETIWRAIEGELPSEELAALVDQMAQDPTLAAEWRLAMDLGAAPKESPAPGSHWHGWLKPVLALGVAAAALMVWVARDGAIDGEGSPLPVYRDGSGEISAGAVRSALPDGGALPVESFVLRWAGGPEGARYDIYVSDGALKSLLVVRGLGELSYQVPQSALAGVAAGEEIVWRVEAISPGGERLKSATFVQRLE